jgi:hypothetical protein
LRKQNKTLFQKPLAITRLKVLMLMIKPEIADNCSRFFYPFKWIILLKTKKNYQFVPVQVHGFFFNVKKALCKQGREKESSLKQLETTLYLYLFIFVFVFQLSCVIK